MADIQKITQQLAAQITQPKLSDLKTTINQLHQARIEQLGQQLHKVSIQLGTQQIAITTPQLPKELTTNRAYQVRIQTISAQQIELAFFPQNKATQGAASSATLTLTNQQLLALAQSASQDLTLPAQFEKTGQSLQLVLSQVNQKIPLPNALADLLSGSPATAIKLSLQGKQAFIQIPVTPQGLAGSLHQLPISQSLFQQLASQLINQDGQLQNKLLQATDQTTIQLAQQLTRKLNASDPKQIQLQLTQNKLSAQSTQPEEAPEPFAKLTLPSKTMIQVQTLAQPNMANLTGTMPSLAAGDGTSSLQKLFDPLIRVLLPQSQPLATSLIELKQLAQQMTPPSALSQQLQAIIDDIDQTLPQEQKNLSAEKINQALQGLMQYTPTQQLSHSSLPSQNFSESITKAFQLLLGAKAAQLSPNAPALQSLAEQLTKETTTKDKQQANQGLQQLGQLAESDQMLKKLQSLHANIRQQQLTQLEKPPEQLNNINLMLPIKMDDQYREVNIQIQEQEHQRTPQESKQKFWQLNLTFDLEGLGKMMVQAKIQDIDVELHVYAEQPRVLQLAKDFSQLLTKKFEEQGVSLQQVDYSLGKISTTSGQNPHRLVQITV